MLADSRKDLSEAQRWGSIREMKCKRANDLQGGNFQGETKLTALAIPLLETLALLGAAIWIYKNGKWILILLLILLVLLSIAHSRTGNRKPMNRMRVQLQGSLNNGTTPYNSPKTFNLEAEEETGVTVFQVNIALEEIRKNNSGYYTGNAEDLAAAIAQVRDRVYQVQRAGGTDGVLGGRNKALSSEQWGDKRLTWRLDVDNFRGRNLRQ